MTDQQTTFGIVGMRFRPPAQDILNNLMAGTELQIQREPLNAYDEFAIMVGIVGLADNQPEVYADVLESTHLASDKHEAFTTVAEDPEGFVQLGYIPKEDAAWISPKMDAAGVTFAQARLAFSADGKPAIEIESEGWGDEVLPEDNGGEENSEPPSTANFDDDIPF